MSNRHEIKIESMHRQLDLLEIMENRHVTWATDTDDPTVKRKHLEIADTLQYAREQFDSLLKIYQAS